MYSVLCCWEGTPKVGMILARGPYLKEYELTSSSVVCKAAPFDKYISFGFGDHRAGRHLQHGFASKQ